MDQKEAAVPEQEGQIAEPESRGDVWRAHVIGHRQHGSFNRSTVCIVMAP